MPPMKRSPGGRPAVGDVRAEGVTCANGSRKMSRGQMSFEVATAQRTARVSLPLHRGRNRRPPVAQAVGDGGHLAARRASLGEPFS